MLALASVAQSRLLLSVRGEGGPRLLSANTPIWEIG